MGGCCCCAYKTTELNRSPPFFHVSDIHTSYDNGGLNIATYPVSEEREPLSSHHTTVSALSTGLLVDTNLDTTVPDTYRPPPAPIPYETYVGHTPTPSSNRESSLDKHESALQTAHYETYVGHPPTPSSNRESSLDKNESPLQTTHIEPIEDQNAGSTMETKVKKVESEIYIEMAASEEVEDENSDELKKSSEPFIPPLQDEEDVCPTCLEDYDEENPKIITKCDHHFHLACIFEWMERSDTCPVCDQVMVFSPAIGG
ncbi:hypothetical protein ACJIZ3_003944 [Penstemon smallii]|uniref:RING-type E3 ubiquitin transferase n=1 Tax=Penstemon smallii TaxID=265156 RepID=A0ABD3S0N2_9LAMI